MSIKTMISSVAFLALIGGAAPAFAAAGHGVGMAPKLSAGDMASIQARCDQLQAKAELPVSLGDVNNERADTSQYGRGYAIDGLVRDTTRVNLDALTVQDCPVGGAVLGG